MTSLGKYELHEQLGRGGFGTVYRATDTTLDRVVALKVLHPQLTTDPDFLERFRNEARLVASLRSPHIVTIHELGEVDGRVFIAMEYLADGSLKQRIENGAIPYSETVEIMRQVCDGLSVAHARGLVHRDIKPGNILLDEDGRAVIADFGLARAVQLSSISTSSSTGGVGTPSYRAPELWRGKPPASPATDIYSLGCVLSEMLTSKMLFDGATPDEIITQHLVDGPQIPASYPAGVPDKMRAFIEQALNKDPQQRTTDTSVFMQGLDGLRAEPLIPTEGVIKEIKPAQVKRVEVKQKSQPPQPSPSPNPQPIETLSKPAITTQKAKSKILPLTLVGFVLAGIMMVTLVIGASTDWFGLAVDPTARPTLQPIVATKTSQPRPTNTSVPAIAPTLTSIPPTPTERYKAGDTRVSPKDGMVMVYVPPGEFTMGSPDGIGFIDENPLHQVFLDAYWIDQTEVTNDMYSKCVSSGICTRPSNLTSLSFYNYYDNEKFLNYPVNFVNWEQANAYCEWAGRQLPSEAQWEKAARGTDGRMYPWGNEPPDGDLLNSADISTGYDWANQTLNDGYKYTSPVGSYPDGISPYGALDLVGNVSEWVADWYSKEYYSSQSTWINPTGPIQGEFRISRGGAWNHNTISITTMDRNSYFSTSYSFSIGFRCSLAEPDSKSALTSSESIASSYDQNNPQNTETNPSLLPPSEDLDIGSTWVSPSDEMTLVYIPGQTFVMGSALDKETNNPEHKVKLSSYWIDQTEVTNLMYVEFLNNAQYLEIELNQWVKVMSDYFDITLNGDRWEVKQGLENYPVTMVSWYGAGAYCEWAGRQLPTEAQWEFAARSNDGRLYPWGNGKPNCSFANAYNCRESARVRSFPADKSPFDAFDLGGNVSEWVADWYADYPTWFVENPTGPNLNQGDKVVRGGSYIGTLAIDPRTSATRGFTEPGEMHGNIGFRCALNISDSP